MSNPACPCQSGLAHAACCGRWHEGPLHLQAPDAALLMRSRYCAYVLDLRGYLLATWHPSTRPSAIEAPQAGLRWMGLEVKRHTVLSDTAAQVAFVARSKLGGRAHRLQELSRFVFEEGQWYYVSSDIGSDVS
jgi:SEC-C motif domain protein